MPLRFANMTGGARYPPRLSREGQLELTKAPRSLNRGCGNSRRFPPGEARADRSGRSVSETRRHPFPFPCSLVYFSEGGLVDPQLRASFLSARPPARQDVPVARARACQSSSSLAKGVVKVVLDCAHRTSTVSSCAFCEQEGHLTAPSPSFGGRAFREQEDDQAAFPPPFPREKARPS